MKDEVRVGDAIELVKKMTQIQKRDFRDWCREWNFMLEDYDGSN